jgi:hypothetical protein
MRISEYTYFLSIFLAILHIRVIGNDVCLLQIQMYRCNTIEPPYVSCSFIPSHIHNIENEDDSLLGYRTV